MSEPKLSQFAKECCKALEQYMSRKSPVNSLRCLSTGEVFQIREYTDTVPARASITAYETKYVVYETNKNLVRIIDDASNQLIANVNTETMEVLHVSTYCLNRFGKNSSISKA